MKHIGGDNEGEYMTTEEQRTATQRRIRLRLMPMRQLAAEYMRVSQGDPASERDPDRRPAMLASRNRAVMIAEIVRIEKL